MKLSRISLWSLTLAGCLPAVRAESWNQFPESGPETTLDSMWASAAYVQTLVEASSAQINISRFRQKGPSNLWAGALGSFGDAGIRNNQPSFDYSAAGYALGYDYGTYGEKSGSLLGLAFGQMFGHQNIQEMPDYPDGPLEGDRFPAVCVDGQPVRRLLPGNGPAVQPASCRECGLRQYGKQMPPQ